MKKTKQILSVFLSVCMIISCMVGMTVTASAEDYSVTFVNDAHISSIKQGDTIHGMSDEFDGGLFADLITIKLAGSGANIATRVANWEADADYNIVAWDRVYYSNDNLGPYEHSNYRFVDVFEYIFTVGSAAPTAYNITMSNGGKAYVNQQEVTEAAAGATVTVVAPQADPGTQFNGWTTTTAGVAFADPTASTTTFVMPASDATITASFEKISYNITMLNGAKAYVNQQEVTAAEANTEVTIVAPQPDPGTEFNGWTTTTPGVAFIDPTAPTTTFYMPESDVTITASFENIAYNITMSNGGKAYVNQQEVTEAEAGDIVTVVAPQAEPGTQFNGWTTTTAGVEFADASAETTTFTMPASDATITASFENILYSITVVNGESDKETAEAGQTVTVTADTRLGAVFTGWTSEDVVFNNASAPTTTFVMPIKNVTVTANYDAPYIKPVPAPSGGSTTPSHSSSSSSSSSDVSGSSSQSSQKMWAQLNDDHTVTVGWDKISGASKYVLMVEKDGKDIELVTTSKNKVTIKITAPNNVTFKYKLKVKQGGVLSDAPTGYTTSLKVYYKPAVKLTQKDGKVTASWKKVPGADSYKVYKVVNGKLKFVTETTKHAVRFSAKSGSTVTYSVSAVAGGNETKLTKGDRVSIKVK